MRTAVITILVITIFNLAVWASSDLAALDPHEEVDRSELIQMVKRDPSPNGENNKAAKILEEAGYMQLLLDILKTTTTYNTMLAIAQTRDERTIEIFKSRLQSTPNDKYLVGSLAYVRNEKVTPILIELLKSNPDKENSHSQDMVGVILNAMMFNRSYEAIALLRERFRNLTDSNANRKSDYAVILLSLSDQTGIEYLKNRIAINSAHALDKLATLCDFMRSDTNIVKIENLMIFNNLLPELIDATANSDSFINRDSLRILRHITRHDFGKESDKWKEWFLKNKNKHPIYTTALNETARKCLEQFRDKLGEMSPNYPIVKDILLFLPQELQNGYGAHNSFLWRLESRPEWDNRPFFGLTEERENLGLNLEVSFLSRASEPTNIIFKKEFNDINIVVQLTLKIKNNEVKKVIIDQLEESCDIIAKYEKDYISKK